MDELTVLVTRAQAGDLEAYEQIVRRFQDMAYGFAYSYLGDFHLAEDAAQEAFLEAHRDLAKLRDQAAFPGWFRQIVRKHCDRFVRRKSVATVPLEAAPEPTSREAQPEEAAEQRELAETVSAAIRALPETQRAVTTLYHIDGYSQQDIAEFLDVPLTTVKKRLHTSRRRLKQRMMALVDDTLKSHALPERFADVVGQMNFVRARINSLADQMRALTADQMLAKTDDLRQRLANGEERDSVRAEAFALVREATRRAWSTPHYDIQLVAAMILDEGWIAEEAHGEGKTITCFPAAYMAVVEGRPVHVVTMSDELAKRDAELADAVFSQLGVSVGYVSRAAVNYNREARRRAYRCDIAYGTYTELGFDHLRDVARLGPPGEKPVQAGLGFAIVDEADAALLDDARTPLIISATVDGEQRNLASVSIREYFGLYDKLAGITGTAKHQADHFRKAYSLAVAVVPTRRPVNRVDYGDRVNVSADARRSAVVEDIRHHSRDLGRPVLVRVATSAEADLLAASLREAHGIEPQRLTGDEAEREWELLARAGQQEPTARGNKKTGVVTIATSAAGRGVEVKLGRGVVRRACYVPSAKKLAEQVEPDLYFESGSVKCCLNCPDYEEASGCAHCFKPKVAPDFPCRGRTVCRKEPPCGLHVIGVERNQSRRLDQQLRATAGSQGLPGSSRFFLSLDDELVQMAVTELGDGKLVIEGERVVVDGRLRQALDEAQQRLERRTFEQVLTCGLATATCAPKAR